MDSASKNGGLPLEDRVMQLREYLDQITTSTHSDPVNVKWATNIYEAKINERQYENEFVYVTEKRLVLIAKTSYANLLPRPRILIYFWNNDLFPLYTLTVVWKLSAPSANAISFRAFFPVNSQELELLTSKPTQIILLQKTGEGFTLELNLPSVNPEMWKLLDTRTTYDFIEDKLASKVLIESFLTDKPTMEQELEFSWARRLNQEAGTAIRFYRAPDLAETIEQEKKLVLAPPYNEFFKERNPAAIIYNFYAEKFLKSRQLPIEDIAKLGSGLSEAPCHHDFIKVILECAWFSSKFTLRGHEILSLSFDGTVNRISLINSLKGDCIKHYWQRIPFQLPIYYAQLFGLGSCPIEIERFVSKTPLYKGALKDGETFVKDLLSEAVALKQWTIPFGAYVQIDIGEIKAIKVFEIGRDVACVLVDESGHYLLIWVDAYSQEVVFTHELEISRLAGVREKMEFKGATETELEPSQHLPDNVLTRLQMGIKILLAAIIRDFWVVEDRQRVFGLAVKTKKAARLRSDWGKKSVVYIPRIRYVGDIQKRADELNYVIRRPHFVIGHLRKALQASERQIVLAKQYGIVVPEGFTFVRPHRRGDKVQETIYRSRSALQCIRALKPEHMETGSDAWFTYELNVKNWLSSYGYEVVHIAASRHGDGGVDIQANKGGDHLLVQCKYWQTEKIGPKVIREMLGTLQTYPEGARGVIVTSAELTEGARIIAIDNGIQFIESVNFSTKLPRTL